MIRQYILIVPEVRRVGILGNFFITDVSAFETRGNRETYRRRNRRECAMFEYARRFLYMMHYLLEWFV